MAMFLYHQGKISSCLQGWKKEYILYIYLYVYNTVNEETFNQEQDLYNLQESEWKGTVQKRLLTDGEGFCGTPGS
ncbi:rCG52977 [Rattus norvegicus]|uniref:RCG52977 n=1 Tax=Rattus norvegicus TaxID=10116 RepID=A6IR40_RAT|nr:rCG52977 [Rattus norvegicus]